MTGLRLVGAVGPVPTQPALALACLGAVAEPVIALDARGVVMLTNTAFERAFAARGESLIGCVLAHAPAPSPALAELVGVLVSCGDGATLTLPVGGRLRVARRALREGGAILTFRVETAHSVDAPAGPARQRFTEAITKELLGGGPVAVLYLDLDRFKLVNDTLGHPIGDLLLACVVERARGVLGPGETLARLGGDEFGVAVAGDNVEARAAVLADTLIGLIDRPVLIQGHVVNVGVSIGISFAPDDGTDADSLVRRADLALYAAKEAGRGVWRRFDATMDERLAERRKLEFELRRAVKLKEFRLHYQAQGDTRGAEAVVGFEALIRWQHPKRGLLAPLHFPDLAEEIGLMPVLGEW